MFESITFKLGSNEKRAIEKAVSENQNLFENESHFVRSAVISFLRLRGYLK